MKYLFLDPCRKIHPTQIQTQNRDLRRKRQTATPRMKSPDRLRPVPSLSPALSPTRNPIRLRGRLRQHAKKLRASLKV